MKRLSNLTPAQKKIASFKGHQTQAAKKFVDKPFIALTEVVMSDRDPYPESRCCEFCGDEADFIRQLGHEHCEEFAVCSGCDHDKFDACERCGGWFYQTDMVRTFGTMNLYCKPCDQIVDCQGVLRAQREDEAKHEARRHW